MSPKDKAERLRLLGSLCREIAQSIEAVIPFLIELDGTQICRGDIRTLMSAQPVLDAIYLACDMVTRKPVRKDLS